MSTTFFSSQKAAEAPTNHFCIRKLKAVLNPTAFIAWLEDKLRSLGTAACPPYHLAIVIGGTSAEFTAKTAKLASTKYLDSLPTQGNAKTGRAFRDMTLEKEVFALTQKLGIGAQFGGKYFCHDVRVIRLPRHGASLPISIAVSCSADRQAKAKITKEGVFIEKLETEPAHFLPETTDSHLDDNVVRIDLNQPMADILAELSKHPVKTRVSLTGTLVVARDLAHAKIKELVDSGKSMPEYFKKYPVTTPARQRPQPVTPQALLVQPPPVAWIPMLITSNHLVALW